MRLNRALSRVGVCSRRDADLLIEQGRVSVDGKVAVLGTIVDPLASHVSLSRGGSVELVSLVPLRRKARLWMHNKQRGVLVSANDPEGRVCLIPELCRQLDVQHLIPIGRLDYTSEGLILLTDDGGLAQRIMRSSIPRYYTLRLRGQIDEGKLKKLEEGITVRGVHYKPLKATLAAKQEGTNAWVNVVVREGMNREVRDKWLLSLASLNHGICRLLVTKHI